MLGDVGDEVIANCIGVPIGAGEQVRDAIRPLVTSVLGKLPAVFAFHGAEQAAEIRSGPPSRFRAGEVFAEPVGHGLEFVGPAADRLECRHTRQETRDGRPILAARGGFV